MVRYLYNFLMLALLITGFPVMLPFLVTSPKRRKTVLQRLWLGLDPQILRAWRREARQRTVWVHALSLGEVVSAVPLVRELAGTFGKERLVFSASTLTGYETAVGSLENRVRRVFYFPYDLIFSVARAVGLVAPDLVIIVETDLWPNFMHRLNSRGIPAVLVNARLSDRSTAGYNRVKRIIRPLLNTFEVICVQSREDARRFAALGAHEKKLQVAGNLKFDQTMPVPEGREADRWRQTLGLQAGRVIVAGSTHPGEEDILLAGAAVLTGRLPGLKWVIAPRDPERAGEVKALSAGYGLSAACLEELERDGTLLPVDIVVIDRIGILAQLYRLGDLAFVGGSLVNAGGHNPLEPAACGKPVLFGPDMSDFRLIARQLTDAGGAIQVTDADSFTSQAQRLLADSALARVTGRNARRFFAANAGAVQRTAARIVQTAGWMDG